MSRVTGRGEAIREYFGAGLIRQARRLRDTSLRLCQAQARQRGWGSRVCHVLESVCGSFGSVGSARGELDLRHLSRAVWRTLRSASHQPWERFGW